MELSSTQIFDAIYERDIDLLLVEEFLSDVAFFDHFTFGTSIPKPLSLDDLKAFRSISAVNGETDVLIQYKSITGPVTLFIENKIDASFQPSQIERYITRKSEHPNNAYAILVAPNDYINGRNGFDYSISYESLLPYFERLGKRGLVKIEMIEIAINKLRRGYQATNDANNLRFQTFYWEIVSRFPELKMERPRIKPARSSWILLNHIKFPKIKIYHKVINGRIDIEIDKKLAEKYKDVIESNRQKGEEYFVENKRTYYLRTELGKILDLNANPEIYEDEIKSILDIILGKLDELN